MARTTAKRFAIAALAGLAVAAGGLATAAPASADGSGSCYVGVDGCLYYDSYYGGADWGTGAHSFIDFAGLTFACQGSSSCDGNGYAVKNDAKSAANFRSDGIFCVYYNSWFGGSFDSFARYNQLGWYGNLYNTYDNDASNEFMSSTC